MTDIKLTWTILAGILTFSGLSAQNPVGTWSDHLVYSTSADIAVGSDNVYSSTGSSVLVYNKDLAELRKLSPVNGLTETGISAIGWSEENKTLVIAYSSTNIDLVSDNIVYNLPDIMRKYNPGDQTISRLRMSGSYAYVACSFGIAVIDLQKKEIRDTWRPGSSTGNNTVYDIAFGQDKVFAATARGLYYAKDGQNGLSWSGNWDPVPGVPDPEGSYASVISLNGRLVVNLKSALSGDGSAYLIDDSGPELIYNEPGTSIESIDIAGNGFIVSSQEHIRIYDQNGNIIRTITDYLQKPKIARAIIDNEDIWIADINNGLVHGRNMSGFVSLKLPSPLTNKVQSIEPSGGKTIITGKDASSFLVSVYENNGWSSFPDPGCKDPIGSLTDNTDRNHVFVSSRDCGLLEFRGTELVKKYDNVTPTGMSMDDDRNLWIVQSGTSSGIKVLKPDGTWGSDFRKIGETITGDIIIGNNGYKWVTLPGGPGLYIFDDNNTPGNTSDDRDMISYIRDSDDQIISNIFSIASDLDGVVWSGTDQGPFLFLNPDKVFDEPVLYGYRVKIPRDDGSGLADYLLRSETITSIAVDGANRKWIGTRGSGVYMLSDDGTKQLANFTEDNSPLFSNKIETIAIDNESGEVWIGTSKGIQSYRANATKGDETFQKVYAFPNPVREDFTGNVTITGLARDTNVKITDVSGNLVFETVSNGGMASWDLNNYRGRRVSTGVYIAFCTSPEGNSTVTKILVIR